MNKRLSKLSFLFILSLLLNQVNNVLLAQTVQDSGLEYDINKYIQDTKKYVVNVISGINQPERRSVPNKKAITGFIVDTSGIIITRNSVLEDMNYVYVKLNNGRELDATLMGIDDLHDFAILKTVPLDIEPPCFAQLNSEKIGNTILIQANNLGYYPDYSIGVVDNILDDGVLQIVGALWPGHTGSPVFNFNGQVIGILTVMLAQKEKSNRPKEGIVIPIVHLFPSIERIIKSATSGDPWLGMVLTEYRGKVSKFKITHINPKSPTEKAGLKLGDEIISYDNQPMRDNNELKNKIQSMRPLESINFVISRRDSLFSKNIPLGKMPDFFSRSQPDLVFQTEEKQKSIFDKYPNEKVESLLLEKRRIQIQNQIDAMKRALKQKPPF